MSDSKTVVPGLETGNGVANMSAGNFNLYARENSATPNGTVVPGMKFANGSSEKPHVEPKPHQPKISQVASGKPIVGFLYSVSRTSAGEYWPLHIGQNSIGQGSDCDIVLSEATVSSDHAVLVVRKMKKPEKVIASIADSRSTNGTMLNGESLAFTAVECKNGDIITIGDSYELLLVLIDVNEIGLAVSDNFIAVDTATEDEFYEMPVNDKTTFDNLQGGYDEPPMFNGTVGMDGSSPNFMKGQTKAI